MKKNALLLGAGLLLSLQTLAADDISVRPFLQAGLTVGGDEIYSVSYDSSSGGGTDTVKAGGIIQFGGGIQVDAEIWSVVASVNYHADSSSGSDYGTGFSRWPVEALAYYRFSQQFKLGVGYRLLLNPQADIDVPGYKEKITFKNGNGVVLEGVYNFHPKMAVAVRYARDQYKAESINSNGVSYPADGTLDGSHLGLFLQYAF